MAIRIKVLKMNEANLAIEANLQEVERVQDIFNRHTFTLEEEELNLVILQGEYKQGEPDMRIVSVFVNLTKDTMIGLKGTLRFRVNGQPIQFAKLNLSVPPEAFGELEPGEGVLVHLNVPVRGLQENYTVTGNELQAAFTEIEYLKKIRK